jgi:hypothetical protein
MTPLARLMTGVRFSRLVTVSAHSSGPSARDDPGSELGSASRTAVAAEDQVVLNVGAPAGPHARNSLEQVIVADHNAVGEVCAPQPQARAAMSAGDDCVRPARL